MADSFLTSADFHNIVQKQITNAVVEALNETKVGWDAVEPFLEAARGVCRSDFQGPGARIRIHAVQAAGEGVVEADEAFLGISVAGRDDGRQWLTETYWLSDLALADRDPAQVRRTVAALERSLAKLKDWLLEQEKGGSGLPEPPSRPV